MFNLGLIILFIASILALVVLSALIDEFDGVLFTLASMLLTPMFFFGSAMVKAGSESNKEGSPKAEVEFLGTEEVKSDSLTTEFFSTEGFYEVSGIYDLGGGLKYDLADQVIFIEIEKDFEMQRITLFYSIRTIPQLQEFYKLRGDDRDFSKYLSSN